MRLLRWFGMAWLSMVGVLAVISMALILALADSVWQGIQQIQDIWNPFNIANFIVTVVMVAPGLTALWLADYLRERR